jgi:hypothetical protein
LLFHINKLGGLQNIPTVNHSIAGVGEEPATIGEIDACVVNYIRFLAIYHQMDGRIRTVSKNTNYYEFIL